VVFDAEHLVFVEAEPEQVGQRAEDAAEEPRGHHHEERDPQRPAYVTSEQGEHVCCQYRGGEWIWSCPKQRLCGKDRVPKR
jgi:hypothetical protein